MDLNSSSGLVGKLKPKSLSQLRLSPRGVLFNMENENNEAQKKRKEKRELEDARRKLSRPPKDKREVTIGPTTSTGPDITVG